MNDLKNALLLKQLYTLKNLGYRFTSAMPFEQEQHALELPSNLTALQKQIEACHLCELSKTRQKVVFGEGDNNASLLFIGDSPGTNEDTQGRPFLGKSGELLTKMIEGVLLLKRSDVYVTNILKCHPPSNRTANAEEAQTCLPYLKKQIELIKPKVVVCLGEEAYSHLTGDKTSMSEVRGVVRKERHYTIVPTYHPNYLLRNPSAKKEVFEDLKNIKKLLEHL